MANKKNVKKISRNIKSTKRPKGLVAWFKSSPKNRNMALFALGFAIMASYLVVQSFASYPRTAENFNRLKPHIIQCESRGNYGINTGNGYYGAYQFSLSTWRAQGGTGYPHRATPATQDEMAFRLFKKVGARSTASWARCGAAAERAVGLSGNSFTRRFSEPTPTPDVTVPTNTTTGPTTRDGAAGAPNSCVGTCNGTAGQPATGTAGRPGSGAPATSAPGTRGSTGTSSAAGSDGAASAPSAPSAPSSSISR